MCAESNPGWKILFMESVYPNKIYQNGRFSQFFCCMRKYADEMRPFIKNIWIFQKIIGKTGVRITNMAVKNTDISINTPIFFKFFYCC